MLFAAGFAAYGETASTVEATLQLDETFKPGVSQIWSPTGQATWDALRGYHRVKKIGLEPRSATAKALDEFTWDQAATLPPGTLIFAGDYTEAFASQIRQELLQKIGKQAAVMIEPPPEPGLIPGTNVIRLKSAIMVSALIARPKFPSAFQADSNARPFTTSKGSSVPVFGYGADGALAGKMGDNLLVLRDDLQSSQIIEVVLYTGNNNDRQRLILARDPGITSLQKGIDLIRSARKSPIPAAREIEAQGRRWLYANTLSTIDQFWMPELKASILCGFGDLIGRTYLHENRDTEKHRWWEIKKAEQLLSLRLDNTGALVESVFKIAPDFLSMAGEEKAGGTTAPQTAPAPPPPYPKRLLYKGPFLACLWRADADLPYLACWVDGDALLRQR